MALKQTTLDQHAWFHNQGIAQPSCCWCREADTLRARAEKAELELGDALALLREMRDAMYVRPYRGRIAALLGRKGE